MSLPRRIFAKSQSYDHSVAQFRYPYLQGLQLATCLRFLLPIRPLFGALVEWRTLAERFDVSGTSLDTLFT